MSELLAPAIKRYDFPLDLSKKIIKKLEKIKDNQWSPSLVGTGIGDLRSHIRSSNGIDLYAVDKEIADLTKKVMIGCVKEYCNEFSLDIRVDEGLNVLKYDNYDKYDFHVDGDWLNYRTLSVLIYLNPSNYTGGETYFKHFDLAVKPQNPSVVLFPSNYAYMHAAQPIKTGKKYVIVSWLHDKPADLVSHMKDPSCPFL